MLDLASLTNLLAVGLFVLLSPKCVCIQLDELRACQAYLASGRVRMRGPAGVIGVYQLSIDVARLNLQSM